MPDAYPQSFNVTTTLRELDAVFDPGHWILDLLVFAQGAIHPAEWGFVERDGVAGSCIPDRYSVSHAKPESISVGEAYRGIVAESRGEHRMGGARGFESQKMLSNTDHGPAGEIAQPGSLIRERASAMDGLPASV